jgi:hypothetical protein
MNVPPWNSEKMCPVGSMLQKLRRGGKSFQFSPESQENAKVIISRLNNDSSSSHEAKKLLLLRLGSLPNKQCKKTKLSDSLDESLLLHREEKHKKVFLAISSV